MWGGAPRQLEPRARHLALVSIDGLGAETYLRADGCAAGLPTLGELMQAGLYAEGVAGVLPTVTYPSHATLVTGLHPSDHGVLNNARPRDGAPWHLDRADVRAETLWDAARRAGLSTAIVTWPSSYGAEVDYLIPENLAYGRARDVAALVRQGSTPGLFESLEAAAGAAGLLPFEDPEAGVPLDRMSAAFAAELVRRHQPNLLLTHFLDFDHRQHDEGPGSAAACEALARIDHLLGQLRAAYRDAGILDRTTFVIVSDHGFVPVHTLVNVASLLREAGWPTAAGTAESPERALDVRLAGGSAAFYTRGADELAFAIRAETELRPRIAARFDGVVRWRSRADLEEMRGFDGASFALCAAPGFALTHAASAPATLLPAERSRGGHGYCPDEPAMDAAFIAAGAGIRRLGRIPRLRMIDVAPTVAALAGITLSEARGVAIAGLLEPQSAAR